MVPTDYDSHPETPYASDPSDSTHIQTASRTATSHLPEGKLRSRISSLPSRPRTVSSASLTSVRRKPLPVTASLQATRFSSGDHLAATLESPEPSFSRSFSLDSPTLPKFTSTSAPPLFAAAVPVQPTSLPEASYRQVALTSDRASKHPSPKRASTPHQTAIADSQNKASPSRPRPAEATVTNYARLASESVHSSASESSQWHSDSSPLSPLYSATMSIFSPKATPPHHIQLPNTEPRDYYLQSNDSTLSINKPLPKSPGASKLGSFFSWGGLVSPASPTTTFSDKSYSPKKSRTSSDHIAKASDASKTSSTKLLPIDVHRANSDAGGYFGKPHTPLATPASTLQVEEMEKELKDISSELAASIKREMDLEDLVERLQAETQNPFSPGKRTSDYFSDSGISSVRYGDSDSKQDELDRMIRKTEQDKAQMRLELTNKVQDERLRRKQLETQIRSLEEKASHVDLVSINSLDANGRLRELEATCEDLRRRLNEERQVKDNFEDLLEALKGELQNSHNERDNLRDEIVPQLRARVEGLEAQAAQHEKLTYEQSKMQQELQTLKNENLTLIAQREQQKTRKFSSIPEDASPGLTRSNSGAAGHSSNSRPASLSRSMSVKTTESREALAERVKDVELQRDALHRALKSLLERQEHQNRENEKKIRQLEIERDRVLSSSPRRAGYDKDVSNLREEINTLRRRAEDAIEQKWQCEKGLSGLKMDLDRAEQEIGSLRSLLQEKDILIPTGTLQRGLVRPDSGHVSSESLEQAYRDLQGAYADSLERIKNLEISGPKDEATLRAMKQLERTLADAISERDFAKKDSVSLREQGDALRKSEKAHLDVEVALAGELRDSAKRVEELATQVRQQLSTNSTLRQRLTQTIERGEKDQKASAEKIVFTQSKLKSLEEQLMAAQQASEDIISRHEEDIRQLKESHNVQLVRMKDGLRSPRAFTPKSPLSPMLGKPSKTPRISSTTSGKAMTVSDDSKMDFLKQRVVELETALAEADKEMEEVVGRMNVAQIEVMELQNEREEAVRETRKLKEQVEQEKLKTFEGRFASLSS